MNTHKHAIALFLAIVTLAAVLFGVIPQASAGPLTPELLIKIYFDPTSESWGLDRADIDINDWPLSKDFIDRWAGAGSGITMNEYAEIGKMEFDMNNQLWPTGGPNPSVRSGTRKEFFDENNARDKAAWYFRRAIAHLTDKETYVTDFMKGQGYVMHTEVPYPALETYIDYSTLTNATATDEYPGGYIYKYSRKNATDALLLGGFDDYDHDGIIEWNLNYPNAWRGSMDTEELPTMKFWVRIDDPNRRQAGEDLAKEMSAVGIKRTADGGPLEVIVTERSACFLNVMVVYDYNIYTGGWSLSADLDFIFDLYHSDMSAYSYANNYPGFANRQFDAAAELVKYPPSPEAVKQAAIEAQWIKAKYQPVVELWAAKGVKGYRTGWDGVVNMAGYGVDNFWSFINMNRTGVNTIKYGFKSDISMLHVICSEWLWDWLALALSYDTLIARNPYNLPEDVGALATDWSTSFWDPPDPAVNNATVATFTIRSGATFHDGNPVTTEDIRYGLLMQKAAGPGVAWNYAWVMDIDHIDITVDTVTIYFGVLSYWAVHWAGFMSIINKKLWQAAIGPGTAANYVENADPSKPGTFGNAAAVRAYHPWEHDVYDPTYAPTYRRADGTKDFKQDGSGPWIFESHVAGQTILFKRHEPFYSDIWVKGRRWWTYGGKQYDIKGTGKMVGIGTSVLDFFHERGNINYPGGYGDNNAWYADDRKIDLTDLYLIANSLGTNTTATTEDVSNTSLWPRGHWGSTLYKFNLDADVNLSYEVDSSDLGIAGLGFGKKMG